MKPANANRQWSIDRDPTCLLPTRPNDRTAGGGGGRRRAEKVSGSYKVLAAKKSPLGFREGRRERLASRADFYGVGWTEGSATGKKGSARRELDVSGDRMRMSGRVSVSIRAP